MTRIIVAAMLGSLFGVAVSAATRQPVQAGGRCIPCGPNKACENPLTVCVPQTPSGNGCCLGLAN